MLVRQCTHAALAQCSFEALAACAARLQSQQLHLHGLADLIRGVLQMSRQNELACKAEGLLADEAQACLLRAA